MIKDLYCFGIGAQQAELLRHCHAMAGRSCGCRPDPLPPCLCAKSQPEDSSGRPGALLVFLIQSVSQGIGVLDVIQRAHANLAGPTSSSLNSGHDHAPPSSLAWGCVVRAHTHADNVQAV